MIIVLKSRTSIGILCMCIYIERESVFTENFIKMEIGFSLRVEKIISGKFIVAYIYDMCLQHYFSYIIGFLPKSKAPIFIQYKANKNIYIIESCEKQMHVAYMLYACFMHVCM